MSELGVHLTGPAARAALAERDITTVYRILCEAGVSQTRIAQATRQQQSDVSAILAGRRVHSVAVLERIADGLGVPRGWMGLAYTLQRASEPAAPDEESERRANLFRHANAVLFGVPIFGPADPIHIEPAPTPVPSRIGSADVAQVAIATDRLDQLLGDIGGIPMTDAFTAHARASEALLGATMREPVRRQLLVELTDAHRGAGYAAGDAGLYRLARQHFTRGMDCAGAAADRLRAVVCLDHVGYWEICRDANEALKFFQLGAATAPSGPCRAVLEYHCAWAFGLLGLEGEALAALRRARDSHEAATDEPLPWEHFVTALPHIEGRTYLALGHFDRAAAALAAAVDGGSHAVRCATINFIPLAVAQLRCGELRAGLQTAGRVIDLAKDLRSVSVRDDLAPLQEAAAARSDSACRDLAHELATLRTAA